MNDRFYSNARAYVTTVRAGSMTAAARELNTTKSGISQKISLLEADLDLKLLTRVGRVMVPTTAGERIFDLLVSMVDAALETEARLFGSSGKSLSGRIALSGPYNFITIAIMPVIAAFNREHPRVRIELKTSDWNVDFAAEDIDLGFRIGPVPRGQFIHNKLAVIHRILCASPGFIEQNSDILKPADLARIRCVMRQQEQEVWRLLGPDRQLDTVRPEHPLIVDSMEIALSAAIQGIGVALIPKIIATPEIEEGKLVNLMPGWVSEPIDVSLLCRPNSVPKAQVAAMRRLLLCRSNGLSEFFAG